MKNRFKGTKGTIIILILVCLVVSYYYYLSNKTSGKQEDVVTTNSVQEITLKNYEISYPPTPKEVVKEFLQISKVLHNEKLTDEEIEVVGLKILALYDDELVANKSTEDYFIDLKSEIATFRTNEYVITNYYTSTSTEVVYGKVEGYDTAKLYGTFSIRANGKAQVLQDVFLLRKDSTGRWKIMGWQPVEADNE